MKIGIREIVFVVLLAAIPIGAWWFVFRPANARDAEMLKQIKVKQQKLRELNRATATIGDLKVEINSLKEAIDFFRTKLPTEKEMDQVLKGVLLLADPAGPYAEQPISIELEGPFEGFYGFLLALETQPRIMRIQQMNVKKMIKKGEGYIHAKCIASVFFERSGKD